jgi:cardiolipin synthase A/B
MNLKLLVGSGEFWHALSADIACARDSVLVQTLSFEGDRSGLGLAAALRGCAAHDRRVMVDEFTRWIQNDRFLLAPWNLVDAALRDEVRSTGRMMRDLEADGVGIRWVNPFGFLMRRLAARNHKKIILVDDRIAYVGGINFSEHNFLWHDLMLRIEHDAVAAFIRTDFERTWHGRAVASRGVFPGLELTMLDARDNPRLFEPLLDRIAAARQIVVQSPYLSSPFSDALARAARRGTEVTIITPDETNGKILQRSICWEGARSGMDVRLFRGMTHLKAMLIDEETLVVGSSNFDQLSYRTYSEVLAVVTDPGLIADFRARVLGPDLERSEPLDARLAAADPWGRTRRLQVRLAGRVLAALAAG